MSITSTDNKVSYQGNGATYQWPFTFPVLEETDIKVFLRAPTGAETQLTSDYYVDLIANQVIYPGYKAGTEPPIGEQPPKLPTGWTITIVREVPYTQETDLGDRWPFNVIEAIVDKATMQVQQLAEQVKRGFRLPISSDASVQLPPLQPGKALRCNADGTGFEYTEDPAVVLPIAQQYLADTQQAMNAAEGARDSAIIAKNASQAAQSAAELARDETILAAAIADINPTPNTTVKRTAQGKVLFTPGGSLVSTTMEDSIKELDSRAKDVPGVGEIPKVKIGGQLDPSIIPPRKILEYVLSGANVTFIDIEGLSLKQNESMTIIIESSDAVLESGSSGRLYFNSDLVDSHYKCRVDFTEGTTYYTNSYNTAYGFGQGGPSGRSLTILEITNMDGVVSYIAKAYSTYTTTIFKYAGSYHYQPIAELTAIRIVSSISNGLKAGTRIKIYKED